MIAQLDLFTASRANQQLRQPKAAKAKGHRQLGSPYFGTDIGKARSAILNFCTQASPEWTPIRRLFRATGMRPSDVLGIASSMTREGLLEETQLHYRDAIPGSANYAGFQFGYRIAQQVKP